MKFNETPRIGECICVAVWVSNLAHSVAMRRDVGDCEFLRITANNHSGLADRNLKSHDQ